MRKKVVTMAGRYIGTDISGQTFQDNFSRRTFRDLHIKKKYLKIKINQSQYLFKNQPKMCSDHYEPLIITLSKIIKSH